MKEENKVKYKPGPKSRTKDSKYDEEELFYSVMVNNKMSAAEIDSNILLSRKRRRADTDTECETIAGTENCRKKKYKFSAKSKTKDSKYDKKEPFYSVMTKDHMSAAKTDSNVLPSQKKRRVDMDTCECETNDLDKGNFYVSIVGTENNIKRKYKPGPMSRTKKSVYEEEELFLSFISKHQSCNICEELCLKKLKLTDTL